MYYEMTITDKDGNKKNVFISGNGYVDAVNNIKRNFGYGWVVVSYRYLGKIY